MRPPDTKLTVIVLAAGEGKRMKSDLPKVLHKINGRPLIHYVLEAAQQVLPKDIIVVTGYKEKMVRDALDQYDVRFAHQAEQLGTGHAVKQAMKLVDLKELPDSLILTLYGDMPLLRPATLVPLIVEQDLEFNAIAAHILTAELDEPTGYGRIIRDDSGNITDIKEESDCDEKTADIKEINTGIGAYRGLFLYQMLDKLRNDNAQGEFYLTDVVKLLLEENLRVKTIKCYDETEILGVNTRAQLAECEKVLAEREKFG